MKPSNSSDPPGDFLSSICIPRGDESPKNIQGYSEELQAMLDSFDDEDWGGEKSAQIIRKKRRLSNEQVEELEKNFNIENKLEPERKAKIAGKLGLHERQVAVWFQNRRARCKAKKMEKEYGVLKSNYDELKLKKECLERENAALNEELRVLKLKLQEKNENGNHSVKEKALFSSEQSKISPASSSSSPGLNFSFLSSSLSSSLSMNWLQFCNGGEGASQTQTQTQLGRMEKQSFFCDTTEESCSFFCQGWNNLDGSF